MKLKDFIHFIPRDQEFIIRDQYEPHAKIELADRDTVFDSAMLQNLEVSTVAAGYSKILYVNCLNVKRDCVVWLN